MDTLIVVSNDKLLQIVPENTPLTDAFLVADDILRQGSRLANRDLTDTISPCLLHFVTLGTLSSNVLFNVLPISSLYFISSTTSFLRQGVVGISEIIVKPGLINVDFADVRTIMTNAGTALMGIGLGKGKTRAVDAALSAISSPLLDFPIAQARGIVFNIVGGPDMTLQEINSAAEVPTYLTSIISPY